MSDVYKSAIKHEAILLLRCVRARTHTHTNIHLLFLFTGQGQDSHQRVARTAAKLRSAQVVCGEDDPATE